MLEYIQLGKMEVSRFILGSNPFSGFSHQGRERDEEMKDYYSAEKIKAVYKKAEELGINTLFARTDQHIFRLIREYWNEGGKLQWIAQVDGMHGADMDKSILSRAQEAITVKAKACYIHGGIMDFLFANNQLDKVFPALDKIKEAGLPAGIAGHNPKVFEWAEENLNVDFYMCCYYNPILRKSSPKYVSEVTEAYQDEDRDIMVKTIKHLKKPAIHYKIMAAGRNKPEEAFAYVSKHLRTSDGVCVGIFAKDKPDMLEEDIKLFLKYIQH